MKLRPLLLPAAAVLLLAGWIFFLRAPSFAASLWNVDEGIHAAVASTLRHGGVLYRDAIDQRTPLSYHAFSAVFAVCGENNLAAVRALVALLLGATAGGLFLLARRAAGTPVAAVAAVLFAALSTNALVPSDAFAAHTEWFAIVCTAWGAWLAWRMREQPTFARAATAGAAFALGFLSKQPALLDLGAPLALVALLAATRAWTPAAAARAAGGLAAGFAAVTGATAAYFAAHGALGDAVFYAWTYNVKFYGPEITALARAEKALMPFAVLWREYPLVLLALLGGGVATLVRLVQLRPAEPERAARPWLFFLLAWSVLAFAGAASGGRGFEHYAIQCLPPFSLLAATGLVAFAESALACWRGARRLDQRVSALVSLGLVAATLATALIHPLAALRPPLPPPDPAVHAAEFVRRHSAPDETIFVWGYNPDIHLYAQRRPASRFVYCSFLTGLIPWTNLDDNKDTAYAIVPGAMDTLLRELAERRPAFIVDCTPGRHRNFWKYPLTKFPALERFIAQHYAVVDAGRYVPQGFRVHLIRDEFRRKPVALAPGAGEATPPPPPGGPGNADLRATTYEVGAESAAGALQRLELLADGAAVAGVSFPPSARVQVTLPVQFRDFPVGRHELATRATFAGGATATSPVLVVQTGDYAVPVEDQKRFALATAGAPTAPVVVQAPYGPSVHEADGRKLFYVHAPSRLAYVLDGRARRVSGACGLMPGAYGPENKSPTDGAGFRAELVAPDGARTVLLERVLRPLQNAWERGPQRFAFDLPPHAAGSRLEFTTNHGPADNGASDWTFWSDLLLEAAAK